MIEHPAYGNIDNGYENDNQEVLIEKHIQVLRRRIKYQCGQDSKYYKPLCGISDGYVRNKHLKVKLDLCESQINDLLQVNFKMGSRNAEDHYMNI